ncbi:flagellar M-ring protein FliF [Nitratireductor aquimarinus]|uniref:Flagellar M-ring protein n=1 Tax=Nitratireductor aquimarinus TaxID=889300 RepID=A0ABU4AGM5_9HYPH|nr:MULTISPECIES: flagellar basal-body MS-ring/collar protein FliF [Nitratireductor]MBN7775181.1 flagellar M-ring protein FliF [Nitratireductor pacificus]MBN7781195.1 flagellar M-ring protein FliF [Nitratireductor pacificus]MBN7790001.1 flagellar M-ring protein FliF [Nitratireductor aquimarinus]MBN8244043.1 flagellar M-ring protein FliF [Nitratireductor aquimarinus]MBY6097568.1 flagellar M-ring protein FliF [Nitratireductor aquimarinus]
MPEQIQTVVANLKSLGPRRLALLGGMLALVMAVVVAGAAYLNKPAYETLYVGLDRSDVNQIGLVLGEAGIGFDVVSDGTAVLVPAGKTAQARMLLAEKGLPSSTNAGYELFDNVGSLGLTTFMQQVTRVRALEGEIARTIQSLTGIKAARVHIVMQERGTFRTEERQPSASVVIRASSLDATNAASSIRYLVAAAVPGLDAEKVTILDSTGTLLASGDDLSNSTAQRSIGVERTVENQIEQNIRRALSPYLGPDNFRASVKADVNTDARQIEEVIFDPDSRVERSVQVVRSSDSANRETAIQPTSVAQNLPEDEAAASAGPKSSEESERREETTNYELNTKRIATTSNGYSVDKMSIAVVVNQARIMDILGPNATPDQINARIADIQKVVASATGFNETRGDVINVSSVEFIDGLDGVPVAEPGIIDAVGQHTGTLINAAAFILVAFLVTWFGLKPLGANLMRPAIAQGPADEEMQRSLPNPEEEQARLTDGGYSETEFEEDDTYGTHRLKIRPAPQERLARMVDLNEERTAHILRKWARVEAEAS